MLLIAKTMTKGKMRLSMIEDSRWWNRSVDAPMVCGEESDGSGQARWCAPGIFGRLRAAAALVQRRAAVTGKDERGVVGRFVFTPEACRGAAFGTWLLSAPQPPGNMAAPDSSGSSPDDNPRPCRIGPAARPR